MQNTDQRELHEVQKYITESLSEIHILETRHGITADASNDGAKDAISGLWCATEALDGYLEILRNAY